MASQSPESHTTSTFSFAWPLLLMLLATAGGLLGIVLLGDTLSATGPARAIECLCVLAMITSVVLIGRSPVLAPVEDESVGTSSIASRRSP